jgi:hypothetical protein
MTSSMPPGIGFAAAARAGAGATGFRTAATAGAADGAAARAAARSGGEGLAAFGARSGGSASPTAWPTGRFATRDGGVLAAAVAAAPASAHGTNQSGRGQRQRLSSGKPSTGSSACTRRANGKGCKTRVNSYRAQP